MGETELNIIIGVLSRALLRISPGFDKIWFHIGGVIDLILSSTVCTVLWESSTIDAKDKNIYHFMIIKFIVD